jgi:hypothetical protein
MTYRPQRNPARNPYGQTRSFARRAYRSDLNAQALIWDRAAGEFQEELDDALRAYSSGLIPRSEYHRIRDRLREAINGAKERAETFRRSGIARAEFSSRFGSRKGRRF